MKGIKNAETIKIETERFRECDIKFIVIEKCSDIEKKVKDIKEYDHEINLLIINNGEHWCHIVSLDSSLNRIIEKLYGKLAWVRENIFCFYSYQSAVEFSNTLKEQGYLYPTKPLHL